LARELASEIDDNRQQGNLSSAIRLFVLDYFRTTAGIFKSVDAKAGHLTVATTPGPSPGVAGS
jgi:predicted DNA-binding ribbon-helix-helix protein